MTKALRTLRLIALITWLGGLIFFAFVVAPVAFTQLPSTHEAGIVVGGTLRWLHSIGVVCGIVIALTTLILPRTRHRHTSIPLLATAMLLLTLYSQHRIIPKMDADRDAAGGTVPRECWSEPCRDFNRLHVRSEHVEEAVMLGGLAIAVLLAIE